MKESMIFPREEKTEILFQKILEDPWACEKLQETFCNSCLCGEETDEVFSPINFQKLYLRIIEIVISRHS